MDRTVAPGQSEQVKVTVTSARRSGPFTRTITATTNDADHHKVTLTCAGTVLVPFQIKPSAISFGQLARDGGPQQKTVAITRGDGGPLALEVVPPSDSNLRASLREIEPGERYELDVEVTPGWSQGSWRTNLMLKTGIAEVPQEKIRVYAYIVPRLRVMPARFTIPRNLPAERELRARLLWSGNRPSQVLEVTSSDPDTPVRIEERNEHQYVVLSVPAGYQPLVRPRPVVTLKTDDPEAPTLDIPVWLAPAPRTPRTPARAAGTTSGAGVRSAIRRSTSRPAVRPGLRRPTSRPAIRPGLRRPTSRPAIRPKPLRPTSRPAIRPGLRRPTSRPAIRPKPLRPTSRPVARPTPTKPED